VGRGAEEEPLVHAVRFKSGKLERTFQAYRFRADGDVDARYFQPTGEELEARLRPSPIEQYEQITSLIRDGRRHKGVDFRAPVGTPVTASFNGVITRKNWNFRSNGNCLEVTENGTGRKALYLHLDRVPSDVRVGQRVVRGQVLASSGNSGRSFAPHLHFQLMTANDKVLDPFEVFDSYRRQLTGEGLGALQKEISRFDALFSSTLATR
jgi:murein DD-endopeptidase MepM/ murein hydrolase activator NlpD